MPITAHRTVSSVTKPSGAIDAVFEYDWHTGEKSRQKWRLAVGTDVDAFRIARVPKVESAQADFEIEKALGRARKGQLTGAEVPEHQTQVEYDRRLIAAGMLSESIETIIGLLNFWIAQEGRNGPNNNTRADTLGVPRPEYVQADGRFGDAQGVAGGVNTVLDQTWESIPSEAWR
jgi:hypothetical protein